LPTAYSKIPDFEPPRVNTYPLPPDIGGAIVDPIAPELGINIIFDPLAPDLGQGKEIYPILGPWQTVNYNSNKTWQERVRDALLYIMLLTHQGQGDVHSLGQVGKPQTPSVSSRCGR
jgi:hypothetical protein